MGLPRPARPVPSSPSLPAGGRSLLSPPSPHLSYSRLVPGFPPPVSASPALPLPFLRCWSRAPGDAGLPTAAIPYLSPRPSLSRATAPLH